MPQPNTCTHGVDLDQDCRDCEMESMERIKNKSFAKDDENDDDSDIDELEDQFDEEDDDLDLEEDEELDDDDFTPPEEPKQ